MLVRRGIACGSGVCGRADDAEEWQASASRRRSLYVLVNLTPIVQAREFLVCEKQRVGLGVVWVEVDDVRTGQVPCEQQVEDVYVRCAGRLS